MKRYRAAIEAETQPLIDDLISGFFDPAVAQTRDIIENFAFEQGDFCTAIMEHANTASEARADTGDHFGQMRRLSA